MNKKDGLYRNDKERMNNYLFDFETKSTNFE
jgi:hypothetical protein